MKPTSKTLGKVMARPHVKAVVDSRQIGKSILVTLNDGWHFHDDPHDNQRAFGTVQAADKATSSTKVFEAPHPPVQEETSAPYTVEGQPQTPPLTAKEARTIAEALSILDARYQAKAQIQFTMPHHVQDWLRLHLYDHPIEIFGLLLLDTQHCLIERRDVSQGTIDSASVHPREILRAAVETNAAAVILYHNHPSGNVEPSQSDRLITERLQKALEWVDVRVLDHMVVGQGGSVSFAERGWL